MDTDNLVLTLEEQLMQEQDISEIDEIVKAFNVNLQKKNIIRAAKLSDVQDKVVNQMSERLDQRADTFSNDDLVKYHKVIQDTLTKSDTTMDNIPAPTININQQVNVGLDVEERKRVLNAVRNILDSAKQTTQDYSVVDVEEIDIEENNE